MVRVPDLERWSQPVVYPIGTTLFREGNEVATLRVLTSGVVKICVSKDGHDLLVGVRTAGRVLGATSAILGDPQLATAVAITACELRTLSFREFHAFRTSSPDVAGWLLDQFAREIRDQHKRARALASGRLEAHLRWLIVYVFRAAHVERRDGSLRLGFPLNVTEIAEWMGVTRPPVSALLTRLRRQGVLVRDHDWWVLPADSPWLAEVRTL